MSFRSHFKKSSVGELAKKFENYRFPLHNRVEAYKRFHAMKAQIHYNTGDEEFNDGGGFRDMAKYMKEDLQIPAIVAQGLIANAVDRAWNVPPSVAMLSHMGQNSFQAHNHFLGMLRKEVEGYISGIAPSRVRSVQERLYRSEMKNLHYQKQLFASPNNDDRNMRHNVWQLGTDAPEVDQKRGIYTGRNAARQPFSSYFQHMISDNGTFRSVTDGEEDIDTKDLAELKGHKLTLQRLRSIASKADGDNTVSLFNWNKKEMEQSPIWRGENIYDVDDSKLFESKEQTKDRLEANIPVESKEIKMPTLTSTQRGELKNDLHAADTGVVPTSTEDEPLTPMERADFKNDLHATDVGVVPSVSAVEKEVKEQKRVIEPTEDNLDILFDDDVVAAAPAGHLSVSTRNPSKGRNELREIRLNRSDSLVDEDGVRVGHVRDRQGNVVDTDGLSDWR